MSRKAPIGLVPAAGSGSRLGLRDRSKEIVPVGTRRDPATGERLEQPVIGHLLERFRRGGIEEAVIVLRSGKEDVRRALGDGAAWGVRLDWLETEPTAGVPHTLDGARERLAGRRVALGFPDILFEPPDAWAQLVRRQEESGADLVLGLFPSDRPEKTDMVRLDERGRPLELVIKQPDRGLRFTWSIALWTPRFTERLHRWVGEWRGEREPWVGDVVATVLGEGMAVEAVSFPQGRYLDVGTPEDLERARELYR